MARDTKAALAVAEARTVETLDAKRAMAAKLNELLMPGGAKGAALDSALRAAAGPAGSPAPLGPRPLATASRASAGWRSGTESSRWTTAAWRPPASITHAWSVPP